MASNYSQFSDNSNRKPFDLDSIIGFNAKVPVLNLTNSSQCVAFAVASAHVVSIYRTRPLSTFIGTAADTQPKTSVQHLIGGHETEIHTLGCDGMGRFILSAADDACVVWDQQNVQDGAPIAIRHLPATFGVNGRIDHAVISPDGKYILLSGFDMRATQQRLQFWVWSAGRSSADYECDLPNAKLGPVLSMVFNQFSVHTEFAITMSRNVMFGTWRPDDKPSVQVYIPKIKSSKPAFRMTTYCSGSVLTISEHGYCTLWTRAFGSHQYRVDKTVHVGREPLHWVGHVDEMVAILQSNGRLRFFDEDLRIVFNGEEHHQLDMRNVSFDLMGRRYQLANPESFEASSRRNESTPVADVPDSAQMEILYSETLPKCTTTGAMPFIVRNMVAVDMHGRLLRNDLVHRVADELGVASSPSVITAFDVDPQKYLLCGGCADGTVFLFDCKIHQRLFSRQFINMSGDKRAISFVLFARNAAQIVVAMEPGELCIVDAIVLAPVGKPIRPSEGTVLKACFSRGGDLFAYGDTDCTAVLMRMLVTREDTNLQLIAKQRSHAERISSLAFLGPGDERLVTYSEDRYVSEYDVRQSIEQGEMVTMRRFRYEQSARVLTACWMDGRQGLTYNGQPALLTCGSQFKVKFWNPETLTLMKTVVGPLLDGQPMRNMCLIPGVPGDDDEARAFMAFATQGKTMGLHLLPFDGNAFRSVGMIAHSTGIKQMLALPDGVTLLTLGFDDHTIFSWRIQRFVVHANVQRGGVGLMPFCMALPGGRDGWLFREMQDLFYYMQILSKSMDCPEEQTVADTIALAEVPDFMRGLGLFLSDFEANNIVIELSDNRPSLMQHIQVSFGELLKAYVNHRPANGYSLAELKRCLAHFAASNDAEGKRKSSVISGGRVNMLLDQDRLVEVCSTMGENFSRVDVARYLATLTADNVDDPALDELLAIKSDDRTSDEDELVDRLLFNVPEMFSIDDMLENVFGLESSDTNGFSFMFEDEIDPGSLNPDLSNEPKMDDYSAAESL